MNQVATTPTGGQFILIIGRVATGKTTFIKNTILSKFKNYFIVDTHDEYDQCPADKKAIPIWEIDNAPQNTRTDESTDFFNRKLESCDLLVIESTNKYTSQQRQREKIFENLLIRKRHYRANLVMAFHSFRSVPRKFIAMADIIYTFGPTDLNQDTARQYQEKIVQVIKKPSMKTINQPQQFLLENK